MSTTDRIDGPGRLALTDLIESELARLEGAVEQPPSLQALCNTRDQISWLIELWESNDRGAVLVDDRLLRLAAERLTEIEEAREYEFERRARQEAGDRSHFSRSTQAESIAESTQIVRYEGLIAGYRSLLARHDDTNEARR